MDDTCGYAAGRAVIGDADKGSLQRTAAHSYRTLAPEGTWALGALLGTLLEEGDLLILTGDLGAGKTNLTKGVAAALGVTEPVTSPTFNIQAIHEGEDLTLFHFDLYRLEDAEQLGDAGVLDVAGVEGASLIEWGEAFADDLGDERLDVLITREPLAPGEASEPARLISLDPHGARAESLADALDASVRALLESYND